ncbi:hypothetical protein OIO90_004794 [Microbotryomycetes sp. JL221]|nr:hypothetical protein OIO90_004794 [Microbotryomycetes sp. JL221]
MLYMRVTTSRLSLVSRYSGGRLYSTAPPAARQATLTKCSKNDGISYLTLDRPQAKNALSVKLLQDARQALHDVRFDQLSSSSCIVRPKPGRTSSQATPARPDTRVLIVNSSTTGIFCAGADLKERKQMSQTQVAEFLYNLRNMLHELSTLPQPTIAALDGVALGGGLELALACNAATKLGLPETRLAIIPGAGGTQRLSRLIGVSRAKDLIFTARALNAAQAHEAGIVNYLAAESESATDKAVQVAKEMLKAGKSTLSGFHGPLALRAAKSAIDVGSQLDLESGLDFERASYATILKTQDRLEGLKAFAEKRAPVYKGE